MIPRYTAKRDASEKEVVKTLRDLGFSVYRLDRPTDLLVGFRSRMWLVEVKTGTKGYGKGLNANQAEFQSSWCGPDVVVLRTSADAREWGVSIARETARAA